MQNKQKSKLSLIIRWVGTIISLAIMVWLLSRVGWKEAWETISQLAWWRLVLVMVLVFVSRFATYFRWKTLLSVQKEKTSAKEILKLTFAGLFASNFMPTTIGGDVFRLAGAVRLGIDSALATASLIADRIVGMTGMTLILPLAIPGFVQLIKERRAVPETLKYSPFLSGVVLPEGEEPAGKESFFKRVLFRIKNGFKKIGESFRYWIKNPKILIIALGYTLIHQLAIYLIITILINGMGESLPFYQVAGIWSLTYFITLLPVSVNGLGLAEVTITNLYTTLGGISTATSIALAVILRLVWMIGSLPGAFFVGDVLAGKEKNSIGVDDGLSEE